MAAEWRNLELFRGGRIYQAGPAAGTKMNAAQKLPRGFTRHLVLAGRIEKTAMLMTLQDVLAASATAPASARRSDFRSPSTARRRRLAPGASASNGQSPHPIDAVRDNRISSGDAVIVLCAANRITSGKHAGLITLKDEERWRGDSPPISPAAARAARRAAALQHSVLRRTRARQRHRNSHRGADLTRASAICSGNSSIRIRWSTSRLRLPPRKRARRSGDPAAVHFAWYGPYTPEKAFGYRVIGDGFVIEMGSVVPPRSTCIRSITTSETCSAAQRKTLAPQHRLRTAPMRFADRAAARMR